MEDLDQNTSSKDIASSSVNLINNIDNNNINNNDNISTTTVSPINYYEDDKEVDEDTPLNKSLKQLSTQNSNKKNKKILYTLWFLGPEWIDSQFDQQNDEKDKENLTYQRLLFKKLINYSSFLIKIPYSLPLTLYRNISQQTTKQNNFSPLYNFNQNQPTSKLLSSYDGSILASTRNTEITFRSSNDNFSSIQKTCNLFQNDKESQWQRLCFSPDNNILAFSSSGCKIYIFLIEKEQILHILSPGMFGLNPKDGIADLAIRHSNCSLDPDQQCYELLILGYDMILRRFHIPTSYNSFTIHPFISNNEQLPNNYNSNSNNNNNNNNNNKGSSDNIKNRKKKDNNNNNDDDDNDNQQDSDEENEEQGSNNNSRIGLGCSPNGLTIPNFKQFHHSVSCMHFSPKNNILSIGGNRKSAKSTNRGSRIKAYVSFWKISDTEPYFTLLNPPSSNENKKDLNNSTDTTYSKPPSTSTSSTVTTSASTLNSNNEEDENFQNLSKTQKIWRKIKYTLFGNYFKNVILHKVVFSNDGKQLLALDLNGTISLWKVPNENILDDTDSEDEEEDFNNTVLESPKTKKKSSTNSNSSYYKPTKIWTSKDLRPIWNNSEEPSFMQQYSNNNNDNYNQYPFTSNDSPNQPSSSSSNINSNNNNDNNSTTKINNNIIENLKTVIDISWWSDNQIIVGNKGGQFTVFSMVDSSNCLLHDPELVSTAQPLVLTNAHNGRFFILETSYTSPLVEKPNLLSSFSVQDLYKSKVKIPIIRTYRYLLRHFNGGDVTDDNDDDPFHFKISREPSNIQKQQHQKFNKRLISMFSRFKHNNNNNNRQIKNNNNNNEEDEEPVHLIRRIIRFQSTTPEQLFKTKVSQKEYNNALLIAEHYGLDKDLVHQKRWIKSLVSNESTKQYLSKVQDINWVLWSCHIRIPLKLESTKLLLEFAFSKTDEYINSGQSLDQLKDYQYIILHRLIILNYLNRLRTYQEIYQSDFDAHEFLRFRDCSLISAAMEYANFEDVKAVSILFSFYSDQILPFRLDILSMIPETTSPEVYKLLLPDELNVWNPKKSLQQDWCQSKEIFEKVLQLDYNQRLNSTYLKRALSSLIDKEYEDIRSARDKNINLYPNNDIDVYSIDYQEINQNNQFYYSDLPILNSNNISSICSSSNTIQEWYKKRAKEIDRKSGQITNSLKLINIAINEKNISNLLDIQRDLEELNYIVYENNSTNNDLEISLESYQSLTPLDRIKLLLSDANDSNIYHLIKKRCSKILRLYPNLIITFFESYSKDNNNLNLVKSFLLNYQKEQFLIFEKQQQQFGDNNNNINDNNESNNYDDNNNNNITKDNSINNKIIDNNNTFNISIIVLLKIGLNCIFNIKRSINDNIINSMLKIIEILPERGSFQDNFEDETQRLHDKKDQFNLYIQTMKILIKYQIEKPVSYFTSIDQSNQQDEIISILALIFKFAKKNHFKQSNWRSTLEDCLAIKRLSFSLTDDTQLYSLFVKNLLSESLFFLANEYLNNCGTSDKIETIVLNAAKEFFNSSSSYGHTKNLEEARSCLELIRPPSRKILREINLIKAIDILYSTFNFNKLPVEVRLILEKGLKSDNQLSTTTTATSSTIISPKTSSILYEQKEKDKTSSSPLSSSSSSSSIVDTNDYSKQGRFELIQILLNNIKDSYLNIEIILQISTLISDWNSNDTDSEYSNVNDKVIVLVILAKFSMEVKKNYGVTYKICQRLIKEKENSTIPSTFNDIWKICSSLALCQDFNDIKAKQSLLSFSLLYCDSDSILILLQTLEELQFIDNLNESNNNSISSTNNDQIIELLQYQKDQVIKEKDQINLEPPFIESKESILKLFESTSSLNQDQQEKENLLLINQNLLYYYQLLNYNDTNNINNSNNFINYQEIETILLELSKLTFQNGDMKSSISYLLYLNYNDDNNFKISSNFFNDLIEKTKLNDRFQSSQERCTKLACYFYSLKLLLLVSPKLQLFSNSIESIITSAKDLIQDNFEKEEANQVFESTSTLSQINKVKSLLLHYYNLMVDSIQEKELAEINTFVDFSRFKQDTNYKTDTIYSFAKSNQVKSLNTSISMAKRYNITLYQVLLKHIEWQLLENPTTPVFILSSQDIDELKNRQHFNNTIQKLQEYYNQINGNQYDKLLYYFDLLPLIKDQSHSNKAEKKLLNFLLKNCININNQNSIPNSPISPISKTSSNIQTVNNSVGSNTIIQNLDFKLLLNSNYNPINQEIKSNITPDNISFFSKLISILQEIRDDDIIHTISLEKIYFYMIENLISKDINNEKSKGSFIYSIISKYKKYLDEIDLQQLYISLIIGPDSNLLSIDTRIQIITLKIDELSQNEKEQHSTSASASTSLVDFNFDYQNDLLLYQSIEEHLLTVKQLNNNNIKEFIGGKEFIKSYDQTVSSKLLNYYNDNILNNQNDNQDNQSLSTEPVSIIEKEKERNVLVILNNLLNQLSTPSIIKSIYITFYPKSENSSIIKYYLDFMNQLLIEKPENILSTLESICKQSIKDKSLDTVSNGEKEPSASLRVSILNNLRNHCYNQEKSVEFKMNLFEMLMKLDMYSSNQENEKQTDLQFIKQHKTQSIIKDIWKDTGIDNSIFDIEITDTLSSIPLFNELLVHSKTIQQLIELSKLLILWNNNQESLNQDNITNNSDDQVVSTLHECWFKLFKKIIQDFSSNSNEIINILISIRTDQVNKFLINLNEEQELLKLLQLSKFPFTTLFKFSLLSNYNIIKLTAVDAINSSNIKDNGNNNLYQFNYYNESKIKPNYLEKDSNMYKIIKLNNTDDNNIVAQDINSENELIITQEDLAQSTTFIKYYLTSDNYIKEITNDQQLLHLIYSNGLISNFISIESLFKPLFNMLLQFNSLNRNKIDQQSTFTSLQYTASMLTIQKNYYHACLVALYWWRIDYLPIQTLDNSLILLEKFLNNSIKLIEHQNLNSNNWLICKEKIILALETLSQLDNNNNSDNNDSDEEN